MSRDGSFKVLTVNPGSSSIKLGLFATGARAEALASRHFDTADIEPADALGALLAEHGAPPDVIAQRVVHGGPRLGHPTIIDADVEAEIERLTRLAPLHNPAALRWIRGCRDVLGDTLPQVAVFDTGFYADLPPVASRYALPPALAGEADVRRYGFHGIAHEAMWRRWSEAEPTGGRGRVISLQLGSGCSATAVRDGAPVDTSMGFSPLEGLMMSTRCGDLDPEVVIYLQRELGYDVDRVVRTLNRESGLLGVSGRSADMRELLEAGDADARLAVDMYCYRVRKYIGAYLAALGGADAILFGGGVGEHAAAVRAGVLEGMEWCGIRIDAAANEAASGHFARISAADSAIAVHVVPVDEAAVMAGSAARVMEEDDG